MVHVGKVMGVHELSIKKAIAKYPRLSYGAERSEQVVKGTIEVLDGVSFEVHITFPKDYPRCFPIVREVSDKIPKVSDRHVNPDGSLCLAVRPQELILCKRGLTFESFMDKILIPHLAREFVKSETGEYPSGEYSHGADGVLEYFRESTGINERNKILRLIELAIAPNGDGMYDACLCGSGRKFKFCHYRSCLEFREMGKQHLKYFQELITKISD